MRRIIKFVAKLLVLSMLITYLPAINSPINAFAGEQTFKYNLKLKTYDDGGGTEGDVKITLTFYKEGGESTETIDQTKSDLSSNSTYDYVFNENTPPWMLKQIRIYHDVSFPYLADQLGIEYLELSYSNIKGEMLNQGYSTKGQWIGDEGYVDIIMNDHPKRYISGDFLGGIKNKLENTGSNRPLYISKSERDAFSSPSKSDYSKGIFVDEAIYINDTYGTYNPMDYEGSPGIATITIELEQGANGEAKNILKNQYIYIMDKKGKFTLYPTKEFFNTMDEYSLSQAYIDVKWKFPNYNTLWGPTVYQRFEYRKEEFYISDVKFDDTTAQSVTNNSQQLKVFNAEKNSPKINFKIENKVNANNNNLAKNFRGDITLHNGNEGALICNLKIANINNNTISLIPDTADGKLPPDYNTGNNGLYIKIENASSADGKNNGFTLEKEKFGKYHEEYRIDNVIPQAYLTDINNSDIESSIQGKDKLSDNHKFYIVSNKEIKKGVLQYSLMDKDNMPVNLKNYNPDDPREGATIINVPTGTQVIDDGEITLALDDKGEGIYSLIVSGLDVSENKLYKKIENIYIDNQAPIVKNITSSKTDLANQERRFDFEFDIEDFSEEGRLYYCFVKEGDQIPAIDEESAGETGPWYFKDFNNNQRVTVSHQIGKDKDFIGKLHYYTVDKLNNSSYKENINQPDSYNIALYNYTVKGSVEVEGVTTEGKPSYNINFNKNNENEKLFYKWVDNNAVNSGFVQSEYKEYSESDAIGDKKHTGDDNNEYIFDGNYKLEYKIENSQSQISEPGQLSFIFDNSYPQIDLPVWTNGQKISDIQEAKIKITDKSAVKNASYRVVNIDNEPIAGLDYVDLSVSGGKVETSLNITVPDELGNGIYGIEIKAEDINGNTKIVKHNFTEEIDGEALVKDERDGDYYDKTNMRFGIRKMPPASVLDKVEGVGGNVIIGSENEGSKKYITANSNYSIKIETKEKFKNSSYLGSGYNTYLKYQVSTDGLNWGQWYDDLNQAPMNKDDEGYNGILNINNPVELIKGDNIIYIRTACFDSLGEAEGNVSDKLISSPVPVHIELDNNAAKYDINYDNVYRTNKTVNGTLRIYNDNSLKSYTVKSDTAGIKILSTSDPQVYTLTIENKVNGTLTITDNLGNKTENINVNVYWIDREAPTAQVEINQPVGAGEREDRELKVKINAASENITEFALINGDKNSLSEDDFKEFDRMVNEGKIKISSEAHSVGNNEVDQTYTIRVIGLDGSYKLGYSSKDSLSNEISEIIPGSGFTVRDAQVDYLGTDFSPMITKSTTVGTVKFNVPVAVLPSSRVTTDSAINLILAGEYAKSEGKLSMTHEFVYDKNNVYQYYVSDEAGRSQIAEVNTQAVSFIEGFGNKIEYKLNGISIAPDYENWIGIQKDGDLKVHIQAKEEYMGKQYFYVTSASAIGSDMRINKELSAVSDKIIDSLPGEELYSNLVFDVLVNGKNIKQILFNSYTEAGLEAERIESEHIAVENIDETAPKVIWSLSTEESTNRPVTAYISFYDNESGVREVSEKLNSGNYEKVDISGNTGKIERVINEREDVLYIKVTNKAGLISTETAIRAENIDKTPISEGKDYEVKYYYENYKGDWLPVNKQKYYRKVKAVIEPITNEEVIKKTLIIDNNNGSFERLLDNEVSFTFEIMDTAGNTAAQAVGYDKFDYIPPDIKEVRLSSYEKTNKPVTAYVEAEDANQVNDIEHCEVYYNKTGQRVKLDTVKNGEGSYEFLAEKSGIYTIYVWDEGGNKAEKEYTVTNINTEAPVLTKIKYSVAPSIKTNQYVVVTLEEFDKANVKLTGNMAAASQSFDMSNIILYINERSLRFKRNGSINVEFIDEYGNTGVELITVENIKTEPPQCKAVFELAENNTHGVIKFESLTDDYGRSLEPDLSTIKITSGIVGTSNQNAKDTEIKVNDNGTYRFVLSDEVGNVQNVSVSVIGIDKEPPKVTDISWKYNYLQNENHEWVEKTEEGTKQAENQKGYNITKKDNLPETNKDVEVTLKTDKEIKTIGTKDKLSKEVTVKYSNNGVFSFDLEAANEISILYGVSVDLIDKTKPIIEFNNSDELIFIKGDTNIDSKYDKSKLYDFKASDYDDKNNLVEMPAEKVIVDFSSNGREFDPDDINANEFNRTKPYYIKYKIYDEVGNETSVTRTVRLIGPKDTVALIDKKMPNANNMATVNKDSFNVSLKNHGSKIYVKYLNGMYTSGEMKYAGKAAVQNEDGTFTLEGLANGWYTVNIQTDNKDYFNIYVYVNSGDEKMKEGRN